VFKICCNCNNLTGCYALAILRYNIHIQIYPTRLALLRHSLPAIYYVSLVLRLLSPDQVMRTDRLSNFRTSNYSSFCPGHFGHIYCLKVFWIEVISKIISNVLELWWGGVAIRSQILNKKHF